MIETDWHRKEYNTWDEAFRGLTPANRQQSVRVAEYTRVLFTEACATDFGKDTAEGVDRMRGQFADVAYKCGLYHQLGKALVSPEYQIWQKDFSDEEKAVYRKYTTDGRILVALLQERGVHSKEKRTGTIVETPTKNIPWLMIRESCEQHMERYDGSGFPAGKIGRNISPIAQIVGLARELDRLSAETKSEHPFEEAYGTLVSQAGTAWDPKLVEILKKSEEKCREIYTKFIYYTMTLPETIPLVVKHDGRPMGLKYRPMVSDKEGTVSGYEAVPWFGGIANRPGETESAAEVEEMLKRTGILGDVAFYLLYEAADAVLRLQNCKIETKGIVVQMFPSFYKLSSQLQRFQQLFEDQPINKEQLMLTIPEDLLKNATKTFEEQLTRYLRKGVTLLLDGYHPGTVSTDHLKEIGFRCVRFSPELYLDPDTAAVMNRMRSEGFRLIGGDVSDNDTVTWLSACGVEMFGGPLTGRLCDEDEIIRDALVQQQT